MGFTCKKEITKDDRSEIIQICLTKSVSERTLPKYFLFSDSVNYLISSENIENDTLLPILDFTFQKIAPDKLQARADSIGDFSYLTIFSNYPCFIEDSKSDDDTIRVTVTHRRVFTENRKDYGAYYGWYCIGCVSYNVYYKNNKWNAEIGSVIVSRYGYM